MISRGPWTEEEKAEYDQMIAFKREMEEELEEELTRNGGRGGGQSVGRIAAIKSVIERLHGLLSLERIIVAGARSA